MKHKLNYFVKLCIILIVLVFFGCEVQEEVVVNSDIPKDFKVKNISIEKLNENLNRTRNKSDLSRFMVSSKNNLQQSKITSESGIVIETDNIKEITQGDYKSYTMLMKIPNTNSETFYNITIEVKNNTATFFITGYLPTENWKENTNQKYEGQIATYRIPGSGGSGSSSNILEEYVEDIIQDSDLLSGQYGFGNTAGGGGPSSSYPWDCDGQVVTTYVIQPVMCSENIHWPWSIETCNASVKAYYDSVTTYECVPSPFNNDPIVGSPGDGNNTGGGGTSSGNENNAPASLTTIISPNLCLPPLTGDLDGNCLIDQDEANFIDFSSTLTTPQKHVLDAVQFESFYYLVDNYWNDESQEFVKDCIDQMILNPELHIDINASSKSPMNIDTSAIDISTPEGQKFDCIYKKLMQSPSFKNLFSDIFGQNNRVNVKFGIKDSSELLDNNGNPVLGQTSVDVINDNLILNININKDLVLNQIPFNYGSNVFIAKVIAHECLHAFLKYLKFSQGETIANINNQSIAQLITTYVNQAGITEHDFMANELVPHLVNVLNEIKSLLVPQSELDFYPTLTVTNSSIGLDEPWTWNNAMKYIALQGLNETSYFTQNICTYGQNDIVIAIANPIEKDRYEQYVADIKAMSKNCN